MTMHVSTEYALVDINHINATCPNDNISICVDKNSDDNSISNNECESSCFWHRTEHQSFCTLLIS